MYFDVKKPEMANKTFRLPLDLLTRLSAAAQQKGVSLNNLVGQCCEYALANLHDEGDETKNSIEGGTT
jgi:predicted HicB family RNase H-like nuclease